MRKSEPCDAEILAMTHCHHCGEVIEDFWTTDNKFPEPRDCDESGWVHKSCLPLLLKRHYHFHNLAMESERKGRTVAAAGYRELGGLAFCLTCAPSILEFASIESTPPR